LHGIPWGAKDLFATKGIKTTWGAEPYRDQVIDYDSTVVERLNEAGAVLVAKLSMGALAQGPLVCRSDAQSVAAGRSTEQGRAVRQLVQPRRRLRVWLVFQSARKRSARSFRRRRAAVSPVCVRRTAASAATARWV
jgi:hypothetical protein